MAWTPEGAQMTGDNLHVGDLVHDGELYDHVNSFLDDLPFYRSRCEVAGGRVLELCCGTGRLTIPLREAGIDIVGLDGSASMLQAAARKADQRDVDVEWVQADIREFDLSGRFRLVMLPFNSLQCIYSNEDLARTLTCIGGHLEPGGLFVFDIFNPSIDLMVERRQHPSEVAAFHTGDGRAVRITETCRYDDALQVNRVKWAVEIDGETRVQNLDMRVFYPLEMDALLRFHGWTVLHKYGSFDERPFESGMPKQIFVCRMAGT